MKVKIKYNDKEYVVDGLSTETTVDQFKEKAGPVVGVEADRIRFIYMGRLVSKKESTLSSYGINEEHTVHMVAKAPELSSGSSATATAPPPTSPPQQPAGSNNTSSGGHHSSTSTTEGQHLPQWTREDSTASAASDDSSPPDLQNLFGMMGNVMGPALGAMLTGLQTAGPDAPQGGSRFARTTPGEGSPAGGASGANAWQRMFQQQHQDPQTPPQSEASDQQGSKKQSSKTTGSTSAPGPHRAPCPPPSATSTKQQQRSTTAETGSTSTPGEPGSASVAGIHVHIHVTLDELDGLPERLERFTARVPLANVHVERDEDASNFGEATTNRAKRFLQSVKPALERAASAMGVSRSPPPAGSRGATMDEAEDAEEEFERSIFDALESELSDSLELPDFAMLLGGDWSPARKIHEPLYRQICRAAGMEEGQSGKPSKGQREALAKRTADKLSKKLDDAKGKPAANNEAIVRVIHEAFKRQRPELKDRVDIHCALQRTALQLINVVLDTSSESFPLELRRVLVTRVGHLYDFGARRWFVNRSEDCDAVITMLVGIASEKVAKKKPEAAPMLGMAAPMAVNLMKQWRQEYPKFLSHNPLMEDEQMFRIESTTREMEGRKQPANRNNLADDGDDALLDEALDEQDQQQPSACGGGKQGGGAAAEQIKEFNEALVQIGLPTATQEAIRQEFAAGVALQSEEIDGRPYALSDRYMAFNRKS